MALQGAGTELDPYLITSLSELRTEVTNAAAYYKVTQDLDVRGTEYEVEWTQCTIACVQLDFNNKKLRNITTALNHDIFRYNCSTSTIINAKFENITCAKHMFGHVTSYTAMTNLNILNSSFSIKWGGNTTGYGLVGALYSNIDKCVFKLSINGEIEAVIWSERYVNRCNINVTGNITFKSTQMPIFSGTWTNYIHFLKLVNHGTKIYLTGNVSAKVPNGIPFLFIANQFNYSYSDFGYAAYFSQCYIAIKCDFSLVSGTTYGTIAVARFQSSWSPANFIISEWLKRDGVTVQMASDINGKTYVVTEQQANSVNYLQSLGFNVNQKE